MKQIYCNSTSICWGDGTCDTPLNDAEHCFDGGDCTYRFRPTYLRKICPSSASNTNINLILTLNLAMFYLCSLQ